MLTRSRIPIQILSPRAMFKRAASMIAGRRSGQAERPAGAQNTPARDSPTNTAPATSILVRDACVQEDCQDTGAPPWADVSTSPCMSARGAVLTGAAFP
jgi:hypothetical protein